MTHCDTARGFVMRLEETGHGGLGNFFGTRTHLALAEGEFLVRLSFFISWTIRSFPHPIGTSGHFLRMDSRLRLSMPMCAVSRCV